MMKIMNETANKYRVVAHQRSGHCPMSSKMRPISDALRFQDGQLGADRPGHGILLRENKEEGEKVVHPVPEYAFGHLYGRGVRKKWSERISPGAHGSPGEGGPHRLFLTDFAPYLTKIKASGAEVIFTGDWVPDAANLLKQARQMGVDLPFANVFMDDPNLLL